MNERSPEQMLADAHRIDTLLRDDAIVAAFGRMERRFYEQFIGATSSEERIRAQSKAQVLREFEKELRILTAPLEVALTAATGSPSRTTRTER